MIREAPWSVGAIAIAAAVASMAFIKLIDSSTIVAKDATIQTLTTENGEYKDKLSRKTPDEAKAQFDAMNGQILELEEKISTIGASGSNLTFESWLEFPIRARRASLRDARRKIPLRLVRRYSSAQSCGARPQRAAEARLAG